MPSESAPPTARMLVLLDRESALLHKACGEPPEGLDGLRERLAWYVRICETRARQSQELIVLAADILSTGEEIKALLKGYNPQILRDTIARLEDRMDSMAAGPFAGDKDLYSSYARLCRTMPRSMDGAQTALSRVSYGHEVSLSDWTKAGLGIVSASNTLGAIAAAMDLSEADSSGVVRSSPIVRSLAVLLVALAGALCPCFTQRARAEESGAAVESKGTTALLDYAGNRLEISGISQARDKNQRGLDVEIDARRNGLDVLATQLGRVCKESTLNPEWKQAMRSMGSEIYADRTFRIMLSGRISDLIPAVRTVNRVSLTSQDGKPLVFSIGNTVPLELTQCGAVELVVAAGVKARVFPMSGGDVESTSAAHIALKFEQGRAALVARDREAAVLLESSSLVTSPLASGQVIRLPLKAPAP